MKTHNPTLREIIQEKQQQIQQEKQNNEEYYDELKEIINNNQTRKYKRIILTKEHYTNSLEYTFQLLYLWDGELLLCSNNKNKTETIKLKNNLYHDNLDTEAKCDVFDSEVKIELYALISKILNEPLPFKVVNKYIKGSGLDEDIEDITIGLIDDVANIVYKDSISAENQIKNLTPEIFNYLKEKHRIFQQEKLGGIFNLIRNLLLNIKSNNPDFLENKQIYGSNPTRILGRLLNEEFGVVLRNNVHTIYKEDKASNGYIQLMHDDVKRLCAEAIGNNIVSDKDIKEALTVIDQRLKPEYNMVRFKNGIYDINKHQLLENTEPVFTLIETNFNYNPNAKSKYINYFLDTSLEKSTKELTERYKEGILQVVGYLFTSGNPLNAIIFIVGIRGGGKSIFSKILTNIFNYEKDINRVSNVNLNDLATPHGTSALENSIINISNDSPDKPLEEEAIALIKQISGNDNIYVNPKFRDPYTLTCIEICKLLVVANHLGFFTELDEALISRIVLIEFEIMFRGTDREDKNLEAKILENPEEMEWLIYNGLRAYEKMTKNNEDFILRLNEEKTKEIINKHSKPINYLLHFLIKKHDQKAWEYETEEYNTRTDPETPYVYTDELSLNIIKLSIILGIDIKTTKNDKIDGRKLSKAIKEEFELFDFRYEEGEYTGSKYETKVDRLAIGFDEKLNKFIKKTVRHYPGLIKDNELWIMLRKIKLQDLRKRVSKIDKDITNIQDYLAKLNTI